MEDLNKSPLFDDHLLAFLRGLLGEGLPKGPINGDELKFGQKQIILQEIDQELRNDFDSTLMESIAKFKDYIPIPDAIFFMVAVRNEDGSVSKAVDILRYMVKERRTATYPELVNTLEEAKRVPYFWAVVLNTLETDEKRSSAPIPKTSSLDLKNLANFH